MDFALFVLLTGILLVRPAEIVPALLGLPLYEVTILACTLIALPRVLQQLHLRALAAQPTTVCVLCLLPAIFLSHLSHAFLWGARNSTFFFAKVVLFYLLLVGIVNTSWRLRRYLSWFVGFIGVLAVLALVQYHGLMEVQGMTTLEQREMDAETGEAVFTSRLRATGIYNDPNDLCLILVVGFLLSLYKLTDQSGSRFLWLGPLLIFGYAVVVTKSRGGFLGLFAGLTVLCWVRFGWRKALAPGVALVPILFLLSKGRQGGMSTGAGTSQERIRMWSEAIALFQESPFFGVGQGAFGDRVGLVAHNSFVHCYAELGLFGGTLFLGTFLCATLVLWKRLVRLDQIQATKLRQVGPFLAAVLVAYGVGLFSLSRAYYAATYLMVGLAAIYARLTPLADPKAQVRIEPNLIRRLGLISLSFLVALYLFVRLFIQRA